jgi:hypothetical protein
MASDSDDSSSDGNLSRLMAAFGSRLRWIFETLSEPHLSEESARLLTRSADGGEELVFAAGVRVVGRERVDETQRAELRRRLALAWKVLGGVDTEAGRARAVRHELRLSGERLTEYVEGTEVREQMTQATIDALSYRDPELGSRAGTARNEIAKVLELYDQNRGGRGQAVLEKTEDAVQSVLARMGLPRKPIPLTRGVG